VKNGLESMWKKADVAQFKVISQHLQDLSFSHCGVAKVVPS